MLFSLFISYFVFGALFSPRSTPLLPVIVCQSIIYNFRFIRFDSHNFVPFPSDAKMKLCKLALLFKGMRQSHEDDTHTHTHTTASQHGNESEEEGKKINKATTVSIKSFLVFISFFLLLFSVHSSSCDCRRRCCCSGSCCRWLRWTSGMGNVGECGDEAINRLFSLFIYSGEKRPSQLVLASVFDCS